MSLDTKTCFGKSETFVRQGEDVVASILRKCDRAQGRASQNRQDEEQSHLHKKIQLDDTFLMENGESQGRFVQVSNPAQPPSVW